MASSNVNLQDSFLNQVRKDNTIVELTLSNGDKYQGAVKGFDNFTLILHVDDKQHLIYKHAVAQIVAPKFSRNDLPQKKRAPKQNKKKGGAQKQEKFNGLDLSNIKLDNANTSEEE